MDGDQKLSDEQGLLDAWHEGGKVLAKLVPLLEQDVPLIVRVFGIFL